MFKRQTGTLSAKDRTPSYRHCLANYNIISAADMIKSKFYIYIIFLTMLRAIR